MDLTRSDGVSWAKTQSSGGGRLPHIGGYTLLEEIGRGSFGVVYTAKRPPLETTFALKVLIPGKADAESFARFRLEAQVASKLEDPGFLGVFDAGSEGHYLYYVMEYCRGQTLTEKLAAGQLPLEEAVRIVIQIARSMHTAHEAGVIHRDLKPSNIMLDAAQEGRPRIADFGLARDRSLLRSLTQSGDLLGTPVYMAPEQLKGKRDIDRRIDIYAIGVILYKCLTGVPPLYAQSRAQLASLVVNEKPKPPSVHRPSIPERLDWICLKALEKSRAKRHATAGELADELEEVLKAGLDETAQPKRRRSSRRRASAPGEVTTVKRREKGSRKKLLPIAAAALLLAAVGIGIPLYMSHVSAQQRDRAELLLREVSESDPTSAEDLTRLRAKVEEARPLTQGTPDLEQRVELVAGGLRGWELLFGVDPNAAPLEAARLLLEARTLRGPEGANPRLELALEAAAQRWLHAAAEEVAQRKEHERPHADDRQVLAIGKRLASQAPESQKLLLRLRLLLHMQELHERSRRGAPYEEIAGALDDALAEVPPTNEHLVHRVQLEMVRLRLRKGRYTKAMELVFGLLNGPFKLEALEKKAHIMVTRRASEALKGSMGMPGPAETQALREVAELDPSGVRGLIAKSMMMENFMMAPALSQRALQLDPQSKAALVTRAQHVMVISGDVEKAFELYDQAMKLYPDDSSVSLGRVLGVLFYYADFRKQWGGTTEERFRETLMKEQDRALQRLDEQTRGSQDETRRWLDALLRGQR